MVQIRLKNPKNGRYIYLLLSITTHTQVLDLARLRERGISTCKGICEGYYYAKTSLF